MKRDLPPIVGERVTLRALREADLPLTLAWRNADRNRVWFIHSAPIAWEQHLAWFGRYRERDDDFVWVIEPRGEARPVGQVSIYDVDWPRGRAECGRLLVGDPAARGRGFAKDAIRACTAHATAAWGLREIYCHILRDNAASRASFAAAGYALDADDGRIVHMTYVPSVG